MFNTVLILKKNKNHNTKIINFLIKLKIFKLKKFIISKNDKFPSLKNKKIDILISYLSPKIVPYSILRKVKYLKINFHPGPPKYPGLGCFNFALLNKDRIYSVTAHEMSKKVDTGKIYKIKSFKIDCSYDVKKIMKKSYDAMFELFKEIFTEFKISKNLIYSNIKWKRKPYDRSDFEKIFHIKNIKNKKHLENIIRATYLKGYPGPYIKKYGKKFEYIKNE